MHEKNINNIIYFKMGGGIILNKNKVVLFMTVQNTHLISGTKIFVKTSNISLPYVSTFKNSKIAHLNPCFYQNNFRSKFKKSAYASPFHFRNQMLIVILSISLYRVNV